MSSPKDPQDDVPDKDDQDELDDAPAVDEKDNDAPSADPQSPTKRGRGRPKGSKNKKNTGENPGPSTPTVPKKRGRPPKERTAEELAAMNAPKRKRGRPPKNPKPDPPAEGTEAAAEGGEEGDQSDSPKKKRGRPKKVSEEE